MYIKTSSWQIGLFFLVAHQMFDHVELQSKFMVLAPSVRLPARDARTATSQHPSHELVPSIKTPGRSYHAWPSADVRQDEVAVLANREVDLAACLDTLPYIIKHRPTKCHGTPCRSVICCRWRISPCATHRITPCGTPCINPHKPMHKPAARHLVI